MAVLSEQTELAVQQTTAMARDTEKFGDEAEEFNQQLACYRRKLTWIIVGVSVAAVVVIIVIIVLWWPQTPPRRMTKGPLRPQGEECSAGGPRKRGPLRDRNKCGSTGSDETCHAQITDPLLFVIRTRAKLSAVMHAYHTHYYTHLKQNH